MELTIVGCSGSVSGPESPASCYLVRAPYEGRTFSLVLDLGPGSFGASVPLPGPGELDAIALSHLHPDHCLDLYRLLRRRHATPPTAPWPLDRSTARPTRRDGCGARTTYPAPNPSPAPGSPARFDFADWQPTQQIGPFEVTTTSRRPSRGGVRAAGRRHRPGGGSLVFSGDTGPNAGPGRARPGTPTCCWSRRRSWTPPTTRPGMHLNGREPRDRRPRPASAGSC